MSGGRLSALTVIVNVWVPAAEKGSSARTTTVCSPTWSLAGSQVRAPLLDPSAIPRGPSTRLHRTGSPSGSTASRSRRYGVPTTAVSSGVVVVAGGALVGE